MEKQKRRRGWILVALTLSLALNLAVVAAIMGAAWRHRDDGRGGGARGGAGHAPYIHALPREDRQAVRQTMHRRSGGHAGFVEMLEALRREPFDPRAAQAVLDAQRADIMTRQEAARRVWLDRVGAMSAAERSAYADRLEEVLERRRHWRAEREGR